MVSGPTEVPKIKYDAPDRNESGFGHRPSKVEPRSIPVITGLQDRLSYAAGGIKKLFTNPSGIEWAKNKREDDARKALTMMSGESPREQQAQQQHPVTWNSERQIKQDVASWKFPVSRNERHGVLVEQVVLGEKYEGKPWGGIGPERPAVPLEEQVQRVRDMGVLTLAFDENDNRIDSLEGQEDFAKFLTEFGDAYIAASGRVIARRLATGIKGGIRSSIARIGEAAKKEEPTIIFRKNGDGTWSATTHMLDINGKLKHDADGVVEPNFADDEEYKSGRIKNEDAILTASSVTYQPGRNGEEGHIVDPIGIFPTDDMKGFRRDGVDSKPSDEAKVKLLTSRVRQLSTAMRVEKGIVVKEGPPRVVIREEHERRIGMQDGEHRLAEIIGRSYAHHDQDVEHSQPLVVSDKQRVLAYIYPNGPLRFAGIESDLQVIPETENPRNATKAVIRLEAEEDIKRRGGDPKTELTYEQALLLTTDQLKELGLIAGYANAQGEPLTVSFERRQVGTQGNADSEQLRTLLTEAKRTAKRNTRMEEAILDGDYDAVGILDLPAGIRGDRSLLALIAGRNSDLVALPDLQTANALINSVNQAVRNAEVQAIRNRTVREFNASMIAGPILESSLGINENSTMQQREALEEILSTYDTTLGSSIQRVVEYEIPVDLADRYRTPSEQEDAVRRSLEHMLKGLAPDAARMVIEQKMRLLFPQSIESELFKLLPDFIAMSPEQRRMRIEEIRATGDEIRLDAARHANAALSGGLYAPEELASMLQVEDLPAFMSAAIQRLTQSASPDADVLSMAALQGLGDQLAALNGIIAARNRLSASQPVASGATGPDWAPQVQPLDVNS